MVICFFVEFGGFCGANQKMVYWTTSVVVVDGGVDEVLVKEVATASRAEST